MNTESGSRRPLLDVSGLSVAFSEGGRELSVMDDVSFALAEGEALALVGESGCGKTITALSVLRLLPQGARVTSGEIRYDGRGLLDLPESAMRDLRGAELAMIFQEPMTSLNPLLRVGTQVGESLRRHRGLSRAQAKKRALELLREAGVPDPEQRMRSYPHELSGGLRQRVMIAGALACDPRVLIADEPTTALDVSIQDRILRRLAALREQRGLALLLITHDLALVARLAQRVLVMYAGQIVEEASARTLFSAALHPYTRGLLGSIPRLDGERGELTGIPGNVPRPGHAVSGCRFRDRCPLAAEACAREQGLRALGDGRALRCWRDGLP